MERFPTPPQNTRIGFHYYPDALHYRESHLATWLPELRALGASWLTLEAPQDRAIPEGFLRGLISAGIEPVLHFHLPTGACPAADIHTGGSSSNIRLLFDAYAQWGVHYVVLFDRPNARASWSAQAWAQNNLVERFLDMFLPLAEAASDAGLFPVFPPLEPGGDFWDTAFLRLALQGLRRRSRPHLLDRLVLGAYAWTGLHPLNWGAGGPERWPAARPYDTPANSEDQRGFRIFDWYLTVAQAAMHKSFPVLILKGGSRMSDGHGDPRQAARHVRMNLAIASIMNTPRSESKKDPNSLLPEGNSAGEQVEGGLSPDTFYDPVNGALLEPVTDQVLACNFWLLAAAPDSPHASEAWFQSDGYSQPIVGALKQKVAGEEQRSTSGKPDRTLPWNEGTGNAPREGLAQVAQAASSTTTHLKPIAHYLLLPLLDWGVSDWHLDVIRPFVKKYHPTIGFSADEALHARRVTVIGESGSFPYEDLDRLRSAGCALDVINGDGTNIATILAMM